MQIKKIKKYQVQIKKHLKIWRNFSSTQIFIPLVQYKVLLTPAFIYKESGEYTNPEKLLPLSFSYLLFLFLILHKFSQILTYTTNKYIIKELLKLLIQMMLITHH